MKINFVCRKCGKPLGSIEKDVFFESTCTHPDESYEEGFLEPNEKMFICKECAEKEIGKFYLMGRRI